jgi:protein involved in polysaccharide export with SLBB domain
VRLGGGVSAAAILLVLASCSNSDVDPSSDAFIGPLSNDLIAAASTSCSAGRIAPGDTVQISGYDFTPNSVVDLRWIVEADNETGTWKSVLADDNGKMSTSVKVTRDMASPGDVLTIQAQGKGPSGLMVLAVDLDVTEC